MKIINLQNVYLYYQDCVLRIKNDVHDINIVPNEISFVGQTMVVKSETSEYNISFNQIKQMKTFDVFKADILSRFAVCNNKGS